MHADFEVFLATNYWEASWGSHLCGVPVIVYITHHTDRFCVGTSIRDALVELSKRHADKLTKPIVKVLFDRGSPKHVVKTHILIPSNDWDGLGLPRPDEIPNISLEVMVSMPFISYPMAKFLTMFCTQNYHRPVMGTFHAKFMVVDRRIAVINSNNVMVRLVHALSGVWRLMPPVRRPGPCQPRANDAPRRTHRRFVLRNVPAELGRKV